MFYITTAYYNTLYDLNNSPKEITVLKILYWSLNTDSLISTKPLVQNGWFKWDTIVHLSNDTQLASFFDFLNSSTSI